MDIDLNKLSKSFGRVGTKLGRDYSMSGDSAVRHAKLSKGISLNSSQGENVARMGRKIAGRDNDTF